MKLDDIITELIQRCDYLQKDEKLGEIVDYINENDIQRSNFIVYLVLKYSQQDKLGKAIYSDKHYIHYSAAVTAAFAAAGYLFLKASPVYYAISTALVGCASLLTAFEIRKTTKKTWMRESLNNAIKNVNVEQDLTNFDKIVKYSNLHETTKY